MSRYATYEKFFNAEQAEPTLTILKEHEIPFEFSPVPQTVGEVFTGGQPSYQFELKIPATEFEPVNLLLREKMQVNLEDVDPDYYLFSFTDEELVDILMQPDEWGRMDFLIARKILETRGIFYSAEELDAIWNKRMDNLARPEKQGWMYLGYFLSVISCFLGIIVGLVYWQSTKTLPNGKRYYIYDESTRKHGKNITYLSIILTAIALTIILVRSFVMVSNNLIP